MLENDFEIKKDQYYDALAKQDELLYRFYIKYSSYLSGSRRYASGIELSMVQVHTLTMIQDSPGITTTQIAEVWGITKGAVSQTIKKLETLGLITRRKDEQNGKIIHLFVTQLGAHVSLEHKLFDIQGQLAWQETLLKECRPEDLDSFYRVLELMTNRMIV